MESMPNFIGGEKSSEEPKESELEEIRKARLAEGDEAVYGMAERERIKAEPPEKTKEIKESEFSPDQLLTIYRLLEGKGTGAAEAPPDFKVPEEIKENADEFFEARERYLKEFEKHHQASEKLKKAGAGEEADAEFQQARWYLENAAKSYNLALEVFKKDVIGYKYRVKLKEFPEIVKLDKKEEYAKAGASVMSGITHFVINDLERKKMERIEKGKEKGPLGKLWEKYKKLDQGTRLGISAGLSGVIGGGLALAAGPGGWVFIAGVAGHRALRTVGGGALAAGLRSLGEKIIGPRFGKEKTQALTAEAAGLEKSLLNEIEKQRKLPKEEKKKMENKLWMSILLDKQAESYGKKLREIARKEGKTKFWLTLASGLVGGIAAAGLDWYFSKPKISEVAELAGMKKGAAPIPEKTGLAAGAVEVMPDKADGAMEIIEKLPIGKRGPEGAIIDYFKVNPEAAKKFGWDGIREIKDWAGVKAHSLWLQDAQEALKNQEILGKLKSLGYSQDMEGYGQMMRRIGKGFVEIDSETGQINLIETDYLRAAKETAGEAIKNIEQPEVVIPAPEENPPTTEELTDPERPKKLVEQEAVQEPEIPPPAPEEIITEETPEITTEETPSIPEAPDTFVKDMDKLLNPLEIEQADALAADLFNKIREGELTADKFSEIYADKLGAVWGMTPELKANLVKLFENLNDPNPTKRSAATKVFKTIMRRLFAIKKS